MVCVPLHTFHQEKKGVCEVIKITSIIGPLVSQATLKQVFNLGGDKIAMVFTDVVKHANGACEYDFLMAITLVEPKVPSFWVSSEKQSPLSIQMLQQMGATGPFSNFMGGFEAGKHLNYGSNVNWTDYDKWLAKALSIVKKHLNLDENLQFAEDKNFTKIIGCTIQFKCIYDTI